MGVAACFPELSRRLAGFGRRSIHSTWKAEDEDDARLQSQDGEKTHEAKSYPPYNGSWGTATGGFD